MSVKDTAYRNAKPTDKPYRLTDGDGLYMLIQPNGAKWWRFDYRFFGKRKTLSMGIYPVITLAAAREKATTAREQIAAKIDPGETRRAEKVPGGVLNANTFEAIAREWTNQRTVQPAQMRKSLARLSSDVFPWLGSKPIAEITAPHILDVMKRIDSRGARYSAHKVHQEISQIIRYAIATGRAERNPCPDLKGAIPSAKGSNFAALIEPDQVAELLRAIDGFKGTFVVHCALKLAPLLFCRPGELRKAKWAEIDLDAARWCYLVTKTNVDHIVALPRQAVEILRELHPLTGRGPYVFPGARDKNKGMSEAAVNAALRRMGYDTKTEITGHGFRAMARTLLHERLKMDVAIIEHQLSHKVPDALGSAYNRTRFLDDRKLMMQAWADYLDELKTGAKVIQLRA